MGIAPLRSVDVQSLHFVIENRVSVVEIPGKGRGVVAARTIARGERIEVAPVIPLTPEQVPGVDATTLEHYVYDWQEGGVAVALGCGSLYNHSFSPNAVYKKDYAGRAIEYTALVDIAPGAEILINYNGNPNDKTPLWFSVVE